MTEDEPFRAAVRAAWHDRMTHLVYADWLDERGDPRGESIRVQDRMDQFPVYTDDYAALKVRARALQRQLSAEWVEELGYARRYRPMFGRLPDGRPERWRILAEFIEAWYSPLTPACGYSEDELQGAEHRLGFRLPAALREWYGLAGKRGDVWAVQDHFTPLHRLRVERVARGAGYEDILLIAVENQSCERWGVLSGDLTLADPPMHRFNDPAEVAPATSAFALQYVLYAVKFSSGNVNANGGVPASAVEPIARDFPRCDVPDRFWVGEPIHYYEGRNVVIESDANDWLWVTAVGPADYATVNPGVREFLDIYR